MSAKTCGKCGKGVYPLEMIVACDKSWHKQCFRCTHCDLVISLKGFATIDGLPYCKPHYLELFKTKGSYKTLTSGGGDDNSSSSYNATKGFKGFSPVLTDVKKTENKAGLKKAETSDKSSPAIEAGTKIKKTDRAGFLEEVGKGSDLKTPEAVRDTSSPKLPAPVKVGDHDQLLKEVESETNLKPVDSANDRSAPVIEKVSVKQVDRKNILKEGIVENPPQLRSADEFVNDRSSPVVEGVDSASVVKTPPQKVLFQEIKAVDPSSALKKPDSPKSSPKSAAGGKPANKCAKCGKTVYELEALRACDKVYHKGCFRCKHCDGVISLKGFAVIDGDPYCKPHYLEIFKTKGSYNTFSNPDSPASGYNASKGFKGY